MLKIEGQKAIVTGASTEIGSTICDVLGNAGVALTIVDKDRAKGEQIYHKLYKKGFECRFIQADITKMKEVEEMVDKVIAEWGQVDILVNSAGEVRGGFITEISEEEWDDTINVHLKGTFLPCQSILPHMIKQGRGKIVNIASVEGKQGFPLAGVHYSAAKGGILAFTRQLALQVSPLGIHVNCVAPGPTEEELVLAKVVNSEELLAKIPLGRFARVEEIANAVLFLASPMAEYLTGETIDINGGKYFT